MADNDLQVIVKAKELAVHSFKLTSNCNRYPKKYRHSLVDRIQVKSLDIYDTLMEANRIHCLEVITAYLDTLGLTLNGKTQIFPLKNGVSYLGFHTYVTEDGKAIRRLKNQNKRNARRKYTRMARMVADGRLSEEVFKASYGAWKNHISHGNCFRLGQATDRKINEIIKAGEKC